MLERDGYAVEKLLLETQPGFWAPANLYLPARPAGRAPAILNAVGHWEHSKAQEVEQARCIGQARKGYVALIWDPLGQGERFQYWDEARRAPWPGSSTEQHAAVCNPALLIGSTVIATMLWDGVRMLDYLAARPEVDPQRIGCTGVSGGGTYTMFLGAFDRRLKATVPVCSTSTLERMHRQGQIGEPCQDPWRAYPDDLDTADLLLAQAPAALRLIGTRWDTFPLAGLREVALEVQDGYAALGIPEKTDLCVVDAHHDYNREQRERMYAWMNRWLEHDAPVEEAPYAAEDPPRLWCTRTGQLLDRRRGPHRAGPGARPGGQGHPGPGSPGHRGGRGARAGPGAGRCPAPARRRPPAGRRSARGTPPGALGGLRRGAPHPPGAHGRLPAHAGLPPAARWPSRRGRRPLPVPAAEAGGRPSTPNEQEGPAVIVVDDRGKGAEGGADGLTPALARAGILALAVDLRGWGETAWVNQRFGWSQDRRALLGADNMLAYVGYMLGAPSVAQRVQDVLGVLRYVRTPAGRGPAAGLAVPAAGRRGGRAARRRRWTAPCGAWRSMRGWPPTARPSRRRRNLQPVADFLPGVLLHYDLPDLAAALAPGRRARAQPAGRRGASPSRRRPPRRVRRRGPGRGTARRAPGRGAPGARRERAARIATWIAEGGADG